MCMFGYMLILAGTLLLVHDILYHLKLTKLKVGKPTKIKGIRVYHAYIGVLLIFLGTLLLWS